MSVLNAVAGLITASKQSPSFATKGASWRAASVTAPTAAGTFRINGEGDAAKNQVTWSFPIKSGQPVDRDGIIEVLAGSPGGAPSLLRLERSYR